jgi:hypothetical protein
MDFPHRLVQVPCFILDVFLFSIMDVFLFSIMVIINFPHCPLPGQLSMIFILSFFQSVLESFAVLESFYLLKQLVPIVSCPYSKRVFPGICPWYMVPPPCLEPLPGCYCCPLRDTIASVRYP